jgi:hypothetical protein
MIILDLLSIQNTTTILPSIIIPSYISYQSSIQNWSPFLASHGIVCMTIGIKCKKRSFTGRFETQESPIV